MSMRLISVGKKLPEWVYSSFREYNKRLPNEYRLELLELPHATKNKSASAESVLQKEADAIQKQLPSRAFTILLDERGSQYTSKELASSLEKWQESGKNICFIIGGADGVAANLHHSADITWSLSPLTFPHALVRVILAEQIYRAWSINSNHPYHRDQKTVSK